MYFRQCTCPGIVCSSCESECAEIAEKTKDETLRQCQSREPAVTVTKYVPNDCPSSNCPKFVPTIEICSKLTAWQTMEELAMSDCPDVSCESECSQMVQKAREQAMRDCPDVSCESECSQMVQRAREQTLAKCQTCGPPKIVTKYVKEACVSSNCPDVDPTIETCAKLPAWQKMKELSQKECPNVTEREPCKVENCLQLPDLRALFSKRISRTCQTVQNCSTTCPPPQDCHSTEFVEKMSLLGSAHNT